MNILVIDDERTFNLQEYDWEASNGNSIHNILYARTLDEASRYFFTSENIWDTVYLDHDLGNGEEVKTFTSMIERDAYEGVLYDVDKFIIHSANPIGRMEIYNALYKFYNVEFARVEDLI